MLVALSIISSLYSLLDGFNDALYYSRKGAKAFPMNEHIALVWQRGLFVLAPFFAYNLELRDLVVWVVFMILTFSFWHNSAYFQTRKAISGIYPDGWLDDSDTSTAKIELSLWQRIALFIIGLLVLIIYMIYK